MSFAPINGIDLYFETKGAGKSLLLLHAGVADSRMWDNQFDEFSKSHFVIRCDLRGFGKSENRADRFSHYEDIAALLNYLDVQSVSLIGASFGGYVALDFVLTNPEMVTALILVAPAVGGYEFKSEEMLEFFAAEERALEHRDVEKATELNLKMWINGFGRQEGDINPQVREQVRAMQLNIFSRPEIPDVEELELTPPAVQQLEKIAAPTLVIVGDKDAAEFQTISNLIARKVQFSQHILMKEVAHLPSMEKPGKFNQLVLDFLGKYSGNEVKYG